MKIRLLWAAAAVFMMFALPGHGQVAPAPLTLTLRLSATVSSADAKVGQIIPLEAVDGVDAGRVQIAPGALGKAVVTVARRRGHNRREGKLVLTLQTVNDTIGNAVKLQSATLREGSGQGQSIFGPCTFPLPADPVGLFRKGVNVVLPRGTEVLAALASTP